MKLKILTLIAFITAGLGFIQAQTAQTNAYNFGEPEHLVDGYSFNFKYTNGTALHFEFDNGKAKYEWLKGPAKGNGNENIPYRSVKLGKDLYLINWHETGKKDYLTIVLDFNKMTVHSSIIVGYENKPERKLKTVFNSGIIEHLKTK